MKITVIGTGYVGLVVGSCLAETGNHVVCADIDEEKVELLSGGGVPIYEPGLERLIARNVETERLRFTTRVGEAVAHGEVIFIAVGTPPGEDGSADLENVLAVAGTVGRNMDEEKVVITKSTVPVGTAAQVREEIGRHTVVPFQVCSNPEFLKEGSAVDDFMHPARVVCGIESDSARPILEELYEPFVRTGNPLLFMDIPSAELTKYAANAMLATRISFMNQIAALCEETGADVSSVRRGIGSDPRIGQSFLFAGTGYGGSCFPKDVRALIRTGEERGIDLSILQAVHRANERQKTVLVRKIVDRLGEDLSERKFGVWGLAFKPETDDMREAPSIEIIEALLERGAELAVHDPAAMEVAREWEFGDRVHYSENEYRACDGADALVIVTEWLQYRRPEWSRLEEALREKRIFDGRNLFEPQRMRERGFRYYPVGREQVT